MNISYNNINHSIHLYGFESLTTNPVIWLLHGAGGDHTHFDHVLLSLLLEKKCRIIVSDVRLHGQSQPINDQVPCDFDGDTLVKDMVYILKQLVNQCGGFKLYLAGFSMGGLLSQLFARSYFENKLESIDLSGMILIASCVVGLKWERIGWMNYFYNDTDTEQTTIAAKEGLLMAPLDPYGKETSKRSLDTIESLENLSNILRFCSKALTPLIDKPEFINTVHLPMLLIAPDMDGYTKGELIHLNEHNKQNGIQSNIVIIENAGHMVTLDQGHLVGQAIARWL